MAEKMNRPPPPPDYDENPEFDFARARPAAEVLPELLSGTRRQRGRPRKVGKKVAVTVRLSPEVLAALEATGPQWRSHVDAMLRDALHV